MSRESSCQWLNELAGGLKTSLIILGAFPKNPTVHF